MVIVKNFPFGKPVLTAFLSRSKVEHDITPRSTVHEGCAVREFLHSYAMLQSQKPMSREDREQILDNSV